MLPKINSSQGTFAVDGATIDMASRQITDLPTAGVRTAVYMQCFAGYEPCRFQIQDSLNDLFDFSHSINGM